MNTQRLVIPSASEGPATRRRRGAFRVAMTVASIALGACIPFAGREEPFKRDEAPISELIATTHDTT